LIGRGKIGKKVYRCKRYAHIWYKGVPVQALRTYMV